MTRFPTDIPKSAGLRERWRTASMAAVWLRPGDWYHPAVDALVEALDAGRDPCAAVQRLGTARGLAGVGMGETIDDLACLYRALKLPPDRHTLRAIAVGWAESQESATTRSGVRDPATGLPTADYLAQRLLEVYGEAERDGTTADAISCLVVLDVGVEALDAWRRMTRSAAVGHTLDQVFGEGHPMAVVSDGLYVVLCRRTEGMRQLAQTLRRVVEKDAEILGLTSAMRRPTRVWVENLPVSHPDAVRLLGQLGR